MISIKLFYYLTNHQLPNQLTILLRSNFPLHNRSISDAHLVHAVHFSRNEHPPLQLVV